MSAFRYLLVSPQYHSRLIIALIGFHYDIGIQLRTRSAWQTPPITML